MSDASVSARASLSYWRIKLLRGILIALVVLAALPAVMTSWRYYQDGDALLAFVLFLYYPCFVVLLALGDRVDHRVRAHALFAVLTATNVEVWLLLDYPPTGTMPLVITVFAGLVVGRQGGTVWLVVNIALFVFAHQQQGSIEGPLAAVSVIGEIGAVGAALLFGSTYLVDHLERSFLAEVDSAHQARQEAEARMREIERRRETEAELRSAQKLSAVGLLTAGVVHDLNNTLGATMGNIELAALELGANHPAREYLDDALDAVQSSTSLTRELLHMTRKHAEEPSVVVLGEVVRDTIELARRLIPSNVVVEVELADEPLAVLGTPTQIQQLVLNLVINARDAVGARAGERIAVRLDAATLDDRPAARLEVRDDGVGMDAATRARIFEPLFTTKAPGEGTGLGLSVTATIVADAGGTIAVESSPGEGSTFVITLPTLGEVEPSKRASGELVIRPRGEGQVVLLVDDDERLLPVLAKLLERAGYEVVTGRDGHEALELAQRLSHYDLLICDTVMPGPSGINLVRRLGDSRALLIAGYSPDDDTRAAIEAGEIELLLKPFAGAEFVGVVQRLLGAAQD